MTERQCSNDGPGLPGSRPCRHQGGCSLSSGLGRGFEKESCTPSIRRSRPRVHRCRRRYQSRRCLSLPPLSVGSRHRDILTQQLLSGTESLSSSSAAMRGSTARESFISPRASAASHLICHILWLRALMRPLIFRSFFSFWILGIFPPFFLLDGTDVNRPPVPLIDICISNAT